MEKQPSRWQELQMLVSEWQMHEQGKDGEFRAAAQQTRQQSEKDRLREQTRRALEDL